MIQPFRFSLTIIAGFFLALVVSVSAECSYSGLPLACVSPGYCVSFNQCRCEPGWAALGQWEPCADEPGDCLIPHSWTPPFEVRYGGKSSFIYQTTNQSSIPCSLQQFTGINSTSAPGSQCWARSAHCVEKSCFGLNYSDPSVCSSHGTCINFDQCACDPGWASPPWIYCSEEARNCTPGLTGSFEVRFGNGSVYFYQTFSQQETVLCGRSVFGDPTPGYSKQCWYRAASCELTCFGLDRNDSAVCSGHGSCPVFNECQCEQGWLSAESWTHCADENGQCTGLPELAEVKYGKGTYWIERTFSQATSVDCTTAVFGDPIVNTGKECLYRPASCSVMACYGLSTSDSAVCSGHGTCNGPDQCQCDSGWGRVDDWTLCGDELSVCNVVGLTEVRFGNGTLWSMRTFSQVPNVSCSSDVFGDPAIHQVKQCWQRPASCSVVVPVPTSASPTQSTSTQVPSSKANSATSTATTDTATRSTSVSGSEAGSCTASDECSPGEVCKDLNCVAQAFRCVATALLFLLQ